jgi:acetyl-CoA acetyltransferase
MARFGITGEDFGHLAVTQRQHAMLNRKALMKEPLTLAEHQASPWIIHPFRLFDCCPMMDAGLALVVSGADAARGLRHSPVLISGMAGGSLWTGTSVRGEAGHYSTNAQPASRRLYAGAGITAADVDFAQLYDPFTGVCLLQLEGFGLVPEGESGRAVREGETSLDGRIPTNTHGGLLSEGHASGFGHVIEAVQQLRAGGVRDDYCEGAHDYDRSRCRQVRDPEIGLVCSVFADSSLLLKRAS